MRVEPVYPRLGQWLSTLRKRKQLSQQALAERLAPPLTRASIANIESGRQRLMVHTALDICRVLEVTPDVLLSDFVPTSATANSTDDRLTDELASKLGLNRADARALVRKMDLPKVTK